MENKENQQQFELITEANIKINGLSNINESLSIHYLIYRIDNLENGKHYVGQHSTQNPLDDYMGSGKLILKAIAKYGVEKFVKTILFDFDNFEEMNEKEKALVPLSACYPHDKTSYNLIEGGTSMVNKFAGKTKEEINEIFSRVKETKNNWTQEQKQLNHQRISEATKQSIKNRSAEEKQRISKQLSNLQYEVHKNRSPAQQLVINQKISSTKKSYSPDKKESIKQKAQQTINAYTEEEKLMHHTNRSNATKKQLLNESKEIRDQRIANRKQTMANKSDEEKEISINKWKQSFNSKSQEEKDQITAKRLKTLDSKSNEEKQQISINKRNGMLNRTNEEKQKTKERLSNSLKDAYRKNPNLAKNHSKRMSGSNNPSYGKRWMNNGVSRVYVKPEEFQTYLSLGYNFGWLRI